jgi:hypothetical protein
MTKSLLSLAILLTGLHANAFLDGLIPNSNLCRENLLSLLNEPANGQAQFKKEFLGTDSAGQACKLVITYAENASLQGRVSINVNDSTLDPFNHAVYVSQDTCNADTSAVSGRYTFRQDTGWHHRFTTKLTAQRLANGLVQIDYVQGDGKITCIGTTK